MGWLCTEELKGKTARKSVSIRYSNVEFVVESNGYISLLAKETSFKQSIIKNPKLKSEISSQNALKGYPSLISVIALV